MKDAFRASMAWVHTWAGLLVCWVLLLIFAAGTASYYRNEITLWMQPELHAIAPSQDSQAHMAERAVIALQQRAPDAKQWFIGFPNERSQGLQIFWEDKLPPGVEPTRERFHDEMLNPDTGLPLEVRETKGGDFFYRLHFDLHYLPVTLARWIVGFCAMFMLVALITGVIIHRRIFKDFFTFRPGKGQRSWLDAHNITGVLALPYHLMITYTGLMLLMYLYMPTPIVVAYQGNNQAFFGELFREEPAPEPSGRPTTLTSIAGLVNEAQRIWQGAEGGANVDHMHINNPNDAAASVSLDKAGNAGLIESGMSLTFDGVSGKLLHEVDAEQRAVVQTATAMRSLHEANFAQPLLRALFFISGLGGCLMIASGAVLWTVKKRQAQAKRLASGLPPTWGLRLVEGLNLGAIAGLPIAFATFFWANRMLPMGLAAREEWEIHCVFIAWAAVLLLAQWRPGRHMWQLMLWLGGLMWLALPVLNAMLTPQSALLTTLQHGPVAVAGFDITAMLLGAAICFAAWRTGKVRSQVRNPQRSAPPELAETEVA